MSASEVLQRAVGREVYFSLPFRVNGETTVDKGTLVSVDDLTAVVEWPSGTSERLSVYRLSVTPPVHAEVWISEEVPVV